MYGMMIGLSFATGFCLSFSSLISFLPGGTELYKQLSLLTVYLKTLIAQSHNSSIHLLNWATVNWARCQTDRITDGFWLKLLSNFDFYRPPSPHITFLFWLFSMSPGLTALFMEKPHPSLINDSFSPATVSVARECLHLWPDEWLHYRF